jgi:hypothetical protein
MLTLRVFRLKDTFRRRRDIEPGDVNLDSFNGLPVYAPGDFCRLFLPSNPAGSSAEP